METGQFTTKEAYAKAAALCSKGEKSSSDIRKKLEEWGLDKYDASAVVEELKREKFIDDERYIKAYVNDKFKFEKWGRIKIRFQLKQKGLSDDLIRVGLNEIDEEKYIKLLLQTMRDKAKTIKSGDKYEKMAKIIRFAQNRGFEPEYIHRHLNTIIKE
jgi:regulatory protein